MDLHLSSELSNLSRSPSPVYSSQDPRTPGAAPAAHTLPNPTSSSRRPRQDDEKKAQEIVLELGKRNMSVHAFLKGLLADSQRRKGTTHWSKLVNQLHKPGDTLLNEIQKGSGLSHDTEMDSLDRMEWGGRFLRQELTQLPRHVGFFKRHKAESIGDLTGETLKETWEAIEQRAPRSVALVRHLLKPVLATTRSEKREAVESVGEKVDKESNESTKGAIIIILSIVCYCQQKKVANGLQARLGLYFHCNGVKTSVIEVLNKCGLSVARGTIQEMIRQTAVEGQKEIKSIGRDPNAVVVYDNLEQMQGVRHQRLEHNSKMISITTGLVIQGIRIPINGLKTTMLDYKRKLLTSDCIFSPGLDTDDPDMKKVLL